ncbi:MAG: VOC family protein [Pseudomonadota bacterium]
MANLVTDVVNAARGVLFKKAGNRRAFTKGVQKLDLGEGSPITGFLEKNPSGGIHHVCYEVGDILAARDQLKASGARVLGDGEPKIGAHGKPVLFLHPKDFTGTLVELEQV